MNAGIACKPLKRLCIDFRHDQTSMPRCVSVFNCYEAHHRHGMQLTQGSVVLIHTVALSPLLCCLQGCMQSNADIVDIRFPPTAYQNSTLLRAVVHLRP